METFRLRFGGVVADLSLRQRALECVLRAQDARAREYLLRDLPLLRGALEERGYRVERLEVRGSGSGGDARRDDTGVLDILA